MWTLLLAALSSTALAQDPAYDGTADAEEAEKPETDLTADVGFTFTSGNAVNLSAAAGLKFSHKWDKNKFSAFGGTLLSLAKIDSDGNGTLDGTERDADLTWTSQRAFGGVRYDRFLTSMDALYVSGAVEHDRFAGLHWRINEQFGYARTIVDTDATHFNAEFGLAYNQENFVEGVDDNGDPVNDAVLDNHYLAARIFLGFSHKFNDVVAIGDDVTMIEPLVGSFSSGELTNFEDFRLYNEFFLTTQMAERFSLKLSHLLVFDNQPVPGFQKVDQTTMVTLVATIL